MTFVPNPGNQHRQTMASYPYITGFRSAKTEHLRFALELIAEMDDVAQIRKVVAKALSHA